LDSRFASISMALFFDLQEQGACTRHCHATSEEHRNAD
jgi:hypothetical protein